MASSSQSIKTDAGATYLVGYEGNIQGQQFIVVGTLRLQPQETQHKIKSLSP